MTTGINKSLDSYIDGIDDESVEEMEYFVNDLIISYEDIEIENIHNKKFIKYMTENVVEVLIETINDSCNKMKKIYINTKDTDVIDNLFEFVEDCIENYYSIPFNIPRSFSSSVILRPPNVEHIQKKLDRLNQAFQPEQRTEEWYAFRSTLLTASNIWKVFGNQSSVNSLIYEKCKTDGFGESSAYGYSVNTNTPMHHGVKYEPVSVMIYETTYSTKLGEYGCIRHPKYDYIAASPDGINVDPNNERYGRMVEIKNIYNREIDGIPTDNYWIQMQFQMEVCELDECDFFETRIKEYSEEEFYADATSKYKGVIVQFNKNHDAGKTPYYKYKPLNFEMDKDQVTAWINNTKTEMGEEYNMVNVNYWRLDEMSNVLVVKNNKWIDVSIPKITSVWETIKHERENGYGHREPKRRLKNFIMSEPVIDENLDEQEKIDGNSGSDVKIIKL